MTSQSRAMPPATTPDAPFGQWLYRVVRSTNRAYAFAVLWCYIGAFVLAFALMFVFPPGTLLLVFLGVFGLVAAVGGAQVLGLAEHGLARRLIARTWCPRCGGSGCLDPAPRGSNRNAEQGEFGAGGPRRLEAAPTRCTRCGAAFESWGGEIESVPPMALAGGVRTGGAADRDGDTLGRRPR